MPIHCNIKHPGNSSHNSWLRSAIAIPSSAISNLPDLETPISLRKVSASHCFGLASYVNKIYHYSHIHTEMNMSFLVSYRWLDMAVFPGMIHNRHRPALNILLTRMPLGLYPWDGSSSRRERQYESGLDNLKEWWVHSMIPASPFYAQLTWRYQWVSYRRFMVMKPKLWFYHIPTRRLDTKRHHAWARRGTMKHFVMHPLEWQRR